MKKLLLIFIFTLLVSCSNNDNKPTIDYEYFKNRHIAWIEIFGIIDSIFNVYIYSKTCRYCEEIKQDVLQYALLNDNFYFVNFSVEVVISSYIDDTIGIVDVKDLKIKGTPTLLTIIEGTLVENVSGKSKIADILDFKLS